MLTIFPITNFLGNISPYSCLVDFFNSNFPGLFISKAILAVEQLWYYSTYNQGIKGGSYLSQEYFSERECNSVEIELEAVVQHFCCHGTDILLSPYLLNDHCLIVEWVLHAHTPMYTYINTYSVTYCCMAVIHIQLYTYTCGNIINNNDERIHFFRKIYLLHFIGKSCERVVCEVSWRLNRLHHIDLKFLCL